MDGRIRIGACLLDPARGTLTRDGAPVHLRAKSFALLVTLARHRDRVLGKDELLASVWPDVTVTEDSLTQAVGELRRVLGDGAVRTVARRGYQLVAEPEAGAPVRLPVLAILPFTVQSEDPQDAPLVDALAEEIIQGVGRYGMLRVIARHTVFQCRPETVRPMDAARRIGADWFVEGTARRLGGSLRLSLALCVAADGRQAWFEMLALPERDWTQVLAALPHRIVAQVIQSETRALALRPVPAATADFDAWQHFIAGLALIRSYGAGVNLAARDHFRAAIARDANFALPHAYLGLAECIIADFGRAGPEPLARGLDHVLRGLTLAPDEGRCLAIAAMVRLWRREFPAAELMARRAVALNPSDADILAEAAYVLAIRGKAADALAMMEEAILLNPLHPDWYHYNLAKIFQQLGRHAEAIPRIECLPVRSRWKEVRLAACYAALGNARAAREHLALAEAQEPGWNPLAAIRDWPEFELAEDEAAFTADVARAIAVAATAP